jgi:hypothetical protein
VRFEDDGGVGIAGCRVPFGHHVARRLVHTSNACEGGQSVS